MTSLAAWRRLAMMSGFAELDRQINKLRMLRDSYQAAPPELRPDRFPEGTSLTGRAIY